MASSTVPSLTAASALTGAELFYGVQGGADVKITGAQIQTLAGGGAPGGATTQVQFNNSGAFSGSANFTWASPVLTVNNTIALAGSVSGTISIKGQAAAGTYNWNLPITAGTSGDLLTSGGGAAAPMSWSTPTAIGSLTDNYNNVGTVFTSIGLTVSGTSYAAGTKLLSLVYNSQEQFGVDPDGRLDFVGGAFGQMRLYLSGSAMIIQNGTTCGLGSSSLQIGTAGNPGNGGNITNQSTTGVFTLYNNDKNDFTRLQFGGTTAAAGAIGRDGAGIKIVGADGASVSWIKVPAVAVASLPSAATAGVGARSFVTDANAPTFGATVAGGGAVKIPVHSDGVNWKVG